MCDINNLAKSKYNYALKYSLVTRVLVMFEESKSGNVDSDDEANEQSETVMTRNVRTVILKEHIIPPEKRSKTDISECKIQVYLAYDTHFHLDRASRRLSGSPTEITIDQWLAEQLERPPSVAVNLHGGLRFIYCDPENDPETVPFDAKWKVAI